MSAGQARARVDSLALLGGLELELDLELELFVQRPPRFPEVETKTGGAV